jgi:coiled-coil domain-containing protein 12
VRFRNYEPEDAALSSMHVDGAALPAVEKEVEDVVRSKDTALLAGELDLSKLKPRERNWDIKRALQPRMERLELRTQRVLAEMVRTRIMESKNIAHASRGDAGGGRVDNDNDDDDEEEEAAIRAVRASAATAASASSS